MKTNILVAVVIFSLMSCSHNREETLNKRGNREDKKIDPDTRITYVTEYYGNSDKKYLQYCFKGDVGFCDVIEYYFNGNIRMIKPYTNSKSFNGDVIEFDSLGKIVSKRFFKDDKEEGFSYTYNKKQLIHNIEYAKNGKLLYRREYDYNLKDRGFIKEEIIVVWADIEVDTASVDEATNINFSLPDVPLITFNKDSFYLKFGAVHSSRYESQDFDEPDIFVSLKKGIGRSTGYFDLEGKWVIYGRLYYGKEENARKVSDFIKKVWVKKAVK